jgi:hypothetical protein
MSEVSSNSVICIASPSSHQQQSVAAAVVGENLIDVKCETSMASDHHLAAACTGAAVAAAIEAEAAAIPIASDVHSCKAVAVAVTDEAVTAAPCSTVALTKVSSSSDCSDSNSNSIVAAAVAATALPPAAPAEAAPNSELHELRVSHAVNAAATPYVVIANKPRTEVPLLLSICSIRCKIVHSFVVNKPPQQQQSDTVTVWIHFASLLGAAQVAQGNRIIFAFVPVVALELV